MSDAYIDVIRRFEGFTAQARWDYAQFTNGYGTRAACPGEVIDRVEAERRFAAEIGAARAVVERAVPAADEGTKAALTSLTFNAGAAWITSGLGDAVRRGDLGTARELILRYNKAGGETLPGLVKRRLEEATWIGGGGLPGSELAVLSPGEHRAPLSDTSLGHRGLRVSVGVRDVGTTLLPPMGPPETGAPPAASNDTAEVRRAPRDPRELAVLLLALSALEEPRAAGERPEEAT
jgi:GH24 family phage-related lysozyme (muramidase)